MALLKNAALVLALTVTCYVLETRKFTAISGTISQENYTVEVLPHFRGKRAALLSAVEYTVDVELNVTDFATVEKLKVLLGNMTFLLSLGPQVNVTDVGITTVCLPQLTGYQCRCEDQYRWSCDKCATYGRCSNITTDTCSCINAIPADGQFCQSVLQQNFTTCLTTTVIPMNATVANTTAFTSQNSTANPTTTPIPPVFYYLIDIEVNTTNVAALEQLRSILSSNIFPISINNLIQITDVNISTVCYPVATGYQCRCEDQYRWSCDKCATYGRCSNITTDTCSCINAIPADGQFCQSVLQQNFTTCPPTTLPPMTTTVANTTAFTSQNSTANPTTTPIPPVFYYLIDIEVNTTNVAALEQLRSILSSNIFPISINNLIQITDVNISTVCYPVATGYQCRCEDQYRWSCDKCATYGRCSNITTDTCSCINAIPADGQFCQSVLQQNFTTCPPTTLPPMTTTVPPVFYYLIDIEVNTTNVAALEQLRSILSSNIFPISINNLIQITDVNISTVCYPVATGYQCRCEDQYRWSCDKCATYGRCSNITTDTCSCINAIPADGQFCQSVLQQNFTTCPPTTLPPMTTTVPPVFYYLIDIEVNTTNVAALEQLRSILSSNIFPISINNLIQITDVNISTVCYPVATGYQCRCEDQYRWSCDKCATYGRCSNITTDTCSCINAIPADGQFCQSVLQQNFTACLPTTVSPSTIITDFPSSTPQITSSTSLAPTTNASTTDLTTQQNTTLTPTTQQNTTLTPTTQQNTTLTPTTQENTTLTPTTQQNTTLTPTTQQNTTLTPTTQQNTTLTPTTQQNTTLTPTTQQTTTLTPTTQDNHNLTPTTQQTTTLTPTTQQNTTLTPTTQENTTLTPTTQQNTTLTPTTQQNTTLTPTTQQNTTLTPTTQQNTTLTPTTQQNTTLTPTTQQNTTLTPTTQQNTTLTPTTQQNTTLTPTTQQNTTLTPTTQQNTTLTPTTQQTTTLTPTTQQNTTLTPTTQQNTTLTPTTQQNTTLTPPTQQTTTLTPTTQQNTTLTPTTQQNTTLTPTTQQNTTLTPPTPGTTLSPTTGSVGVVWNMQFSLDRTFTDDLNDITSFEYNILKNGIEPKLRQQYGKTPGFLSATIKKFRSGSVIVDFEVVTTNTNLADIKSVESGLIAALAPVFIVRTDSFKTTYESLVPLPYSPNPMYPGLTLTLTCGPPPAFIVTGDLGVTWKVKGQDTSGNPNFIINNQSKTLTVKNTSPSDTGLYECTLKGSSVDFHQTGNVIVNEAPNVRAPTQINSQCEVGGSTPLECCVQKPYQVEWKDQNSKVSVVFQDYCVTCTFSMPDTCENTETTNFVCQVKNSSGYSVKTKLTIFTEDVNCENDEFGVGRKDDVSVIKCGSGEKGLIQAVCDGVNWVDRRDTCVLTVILNLQTDSESLQEEGVPDFVKDLQNTTEGNQKNIERSTATISILVTILKNVASVSTNVSRDVMEGFLKTVNVLISVGAQDSWGQLNANTSGNTGNTGNTSSILLGSLETITGALQGDPFVFNTSTMILTRTKFLQNSFSSEQSSSVGLHIPQINSSNNFINTIAFTTLNNVLPARNGRNLTVNGTIINGNVLLVKLNGTVTNVSLSFEKLNKSLANVQCVFWSFDLEGWNDEGCHLQSDDNETVTCNCNHLTSFSILMSPSNDGFSDEEQKVLDIITYIGVGISMGSLVVCLIIEACVWKSMTRNSTSYMRHVSIVNIAVSLLIADIWFIIGASISANPGEDKYAACSAATFFIHFFYLSLFFWMLISGLLLFYRTIMVFSHMSKSTMLAIGFSVGYGAPLIIAVVTVASTAPNETYIRNDTEMACWLNWDSSKALLAFVIPALSIVLINFLILIVVLYKMLRRGVGDTAQPDEKNTLVVIARCLAILTPFFGLTWALGVGTLVDYNNFGTHVAFAFFNSLQGFFILVFGTLLDSKIRAAITRLFRGASGSTQGTGTRSTSTGPSSSSALNILRRMRRRNVYNVSEVANTSSSAATESFINI
ncbi:adhesion G protein-coupled receptor F5-like isoform X2 [Osmerus eperlanus]|uniref:adhesion G protein-coupled receptor F5-like isoform X2 n=1 Tax=Osmerus eperlanus TaxID=29151 RepID=UPI002E14EFD1